MKSFGFVPGVAVLVASMATGAAAQSWKTIPSLQIKGQHFFYQNNGSEFFIRGVAYQQGVSSNGTESSGPAPPDPLADPDGCRRDIPNLVDLQTNTVRVYALDPTKDHDDCMQQLADNGIYVVADLSTPSMSINRNDPSWDGDLYERYISVIDAMAKYNNVMGFFAGNEVSNSPNTTAASAFVKAAVRDAKGYIKQQNYRPIGVGYATYDGDIRDQLADYFVCGDPSTSIDFWGYNVYSWCYQSSFKDSGYQARTQFFQDYPVPIFFAEYGCVQPGKGPRPFDEVQAIYGPDMTDVWSGGIVYEYFQEENHYGLVQVDGSSASKLPDYTSLSSQLAKITPSSTDMAAYNPATSTRTCPDVVSTGSQAWLATASPLPPTPNQELCQCEMQSLSCISSDMNMQDYQDDFNYICGSQPNPCGGIEANATTGKFGAYGMCNAQQKLSYVMNQYYNLHGQSASACDFNGHASTKAASSATGSCQPLLQAAGSDGSGTVPQPTGNSNSQGGQAASSSSKAAAPGLLIPSFDTGLWQMSLYVLGAAGTGAGMILL